MKIKIVKFYRTRGGEKTLALAVNPLAEKGSKYELVAVDEDGDVTDYGMDGKFLGNGDPSNYDLVEEWVEQEDAPLEFGDIEFGTAFKLASQADLNIAVYATSITDSGITLGNSAVGFARLKSEFLMQLPGTKEWLPCSKKSVRI